MASKRCAGINKNGSPCKRMTNEGDLCEIHQRMKLDAERQERELEQGFELRVSAYNKERIEFVVGRPEYDFINVDSFVTWLFENARASNSLLTLLLDVFESDRRS